MREYRYAIIMPDEDGNILHYLTQSEEKDINQLMEDYGIKQWIENYDDPIYWGEGKAMLVKVQCINPIPIKEVTTWQLPEGQ